MTVDAQRAAHRNDGYSPLMRTDRAICDIYKLGWGVRTTCRWTRRTSRSTPQRVANSSYHYTSDQPNEMPAILRFLKLKHGHSAIQFSCKDFVKYELKRRKANLEIGKVKMYKYSR